MNLSIIIVSWRVKELLEKCLASIFLYTKNLNFEILVVDNNSSDGTVEMVKEKFPQIKLIANKVNQGFSKANNQAIKKAKGEYILLLNPDTEIFDNIFSKMIEFMEKHSQVGILGPKLLNSDHTLQPSCRTFPTLLSQILILLKLHNFFPKLEPIKKYYMLDWNHDEDKEVDQVMGACFMIKKEVIDNVGLLDENYWILFEEVDFCRRVKKIGKWQVYFTPKTEIIHHKSRAFLRQTNLIKKQRDFNRSLRYYFKKHHSFGEWLILCLLHPVSLLITMIVQLFLITKIPLKKKKYL